MTGQVQTVRHGLTPDAIARLLPMHLWIGPDGTVLSAGPTLSKIIGDAPGQIAGIFANGRPGGAEDVMTAVTTGARHGERLFLRMLASPFLGLRGHAVEGPSGTLLLNLGFGIGLPDAVRCAGLTDRDFAPPELAMELLFMREAVGGVLAELSRFNSQLEAARAAAEVQAHTDPLTGLRNRRGLEIALTEALRRTGATAVGGRGSGFALAHLDLDHFKQVNDLLGHAAGDRVLCEVARVLSGATRADDTAARLGGDEFVLILNGMEDLTALRRLAQRVISGIEATLSREGDGCSVSASIGIVLSRQYRGRSAEEMLAASDVALYRSKREGRARVTILSERPDDPEAG